MKDQLIPLAKRLKTTSDLHRDTCRILCVDMSLRATGYALLSMRYVGYNLNKFVRSLDDFGCYKTEKRGLNRFHSLEEDAMQLRDVMVKFKKKEQETKIDAIIVEFPSFTQSAVSAVAIGMLWGAWSDRMYDPYFISIEETALKEWSHSKRGDKKDKVKQDVMDRVGLPEKAARNNNIVDAVGIALMFSDLYHATETNR